MNGESRSICVNCNQFQKEETRPTFDSIEFYFWTYFSYHLCVFFLFKFILFIIVLSQRTHLYNTQCNDGLWRWNYKLCYYLLFNNNIDFYFLLINFLLLLCVNSQHKYGHWQLFTILELIVTIVADDWWCWWLAMTMSMMLKWGN